MRRKIRKRLIVLVLAAALVVLLLILTGRLVVQPDPWMHDTLERALPAVLIQVDTDSMAVALTIDDAPHPDVTPGILAVLRAHRAHATFFVIGSHAEQHPELVEAIRAGGHELGNHFYLDRPSIALDDDELVAMLLKTDALIRPAGPRKWCRPGSGWIDQRMIALLADHDYHPCLASVYPLDLTTPPWFNQWHFVANARPGAILVLHDGGPERAGTIATLEAVLPRLQERGYRVVTVSELWAMRRGAAP